MICFVYLSAECLSNKFYGINRRSKFGAKLLDRFFHRRRQVSPPVNSLRHRFLDGSQHVLYCNVTIGSRHSSSVIPDDRYAAKCVTIDCHVAEGRERQMSGHQELAIRRQVPQKFDADTSRLFGVVLEAIVPLRLIEPDLKHGVAGERHPVAAGRQADHAVSGGMAAGATDNYARRHLVLLLERPQLSAVVIHEPLGRPP